MLISCTFAAIENNATTICSEDYWVATYDACDDGTSDYKLVIDNPTGDAMAINSAFLRLGDANYTIEAWCIPDEVDIKYSSVYSPNTCPVGHSAYTDQCIDNDINECTPSRILLYFDMDNPGISYNATWVNAENTSEVCIDPGADGCSCPGLLECGSL